ncbi:hypothetical protein EZV62_026606 [Acer yangbiense]|uniref:Alcohol dehydrogenase-like C-terminal domain-containing protein n=1 Tax=Acer yangbiense TaxID=1000413 RepID=A0A5C7GSL9_9ROSI|nr:hypothetical protein EZV62_026606 [Acer yangbiense]
MPFDTPPYHGSDEKLAFCMKLGADVCINYKTEDFVARVKEETGGKAAGLRSRSLENKAEIVSEVEKYVWLQSQRVRYSCNTLKIGDNELQLQGFSALQGMRRQD